MESGRETATRSGHRAQDVQSRFCFRPSRERPVIV